MGQLFVESGRAVLLSSKHQGRRWRAQGGRRNTARPLSPRGGGPGGERPHSSSSTADPQAASAI